MLELRWCMQSWSHHRNGALSSDSKKCKSATLALNVVQVGLHLCQHPMLKLCQHPIVNYRQMSSVRIGLTPQVILFSC